MKEENKSEDRYQTAIAQLRHDAQLLWQIFGSFLLAHTVLLAFLLHYALGRQQIVGYYPGGFFAALVGLLLGVLWLASHGRSSAYYDLRMGQAKDAEPSGWNLLTGKGEEFSQGKSVTIGGTPYQIPWLSRVLTTKYSAPLLIVTFILIYLSIFILNGPWW